MKTTLPLVALLVVSARTAAGADDPIPGRDGQYEFAGRSVEGTVWKGECSDEPNVVFIARFERGGVLCYTCRSGTYRNGTWKQDGASIYMETNNRYAEFRGVLRGDRITGEAANVAGLKWKWEVKSAGPIAAEPQPPVRGMRPPFFIGRDPAPVFRRPWFR
jgi:hypothetical protein